MGIVVLQRGRGIIVKFLVIAAEIAALVVGAALFVSKSRAAGGTEKGGKFA